MRVRKVFAVVCSVAMLTSMSALCVLAETHTFTNFSITSGGGWKTVPDGNTKDDNEQKAYITVTTRSNSSIVYTRVKRVSDSSVCTGESAITSTGTKTVNYYSYKNVQAGQQMKVQFQATTQNNTITGRWTP